MAGRDCLPAVDVEGAEFSFGGGGHYGFDYLCNGEDGAVVVGVSGVAVHEEMPSRSASCLCFGEIRCIAVAREDHVACSVSYDGVGMGCSIVEELLDFGFGALGRIGLLGGDGSEGCEHGAVDGS